jgi:hypothetical protein
MINHVDAVYKHEEKETDLFLKKNKVKNIKKTFDDNLIIYSYSSEKELDLTFHKNAYNLTHNQ